MSIGRAIPRWHRQAEGLLARVSFRSGAADYRSTRRGGQPKLEWRAGTSEIQKKPKREPVPLRRQKLPDSWQLEHFCLTLAGSHDRIRTERWGLLIRSLVPSGGRPRCPFLMPLIAHAVPSFIMFPLTDDYGGLLGQRSKYAGPLARCGRSSSRPLLSIALFVGSVLAAGCSHSDSAVDTPASAPATKVATPAKFASSQFGYSVEFDQPGWNRWENVTDIVPEAEWGATRGDARLMVLPVALLDQDPRLEALTQALIARMGIRYPDPQVREFKQFNEQGASGNRFALRRSIEGVDFQYQVKVVKRSGIGYLIAAWSAKPNASDELRWAVNQVRLDGKPTAARSTLPDELRYSHAVVFNDLGMFYFNTREFARSIGCFQLAFELNDSDPVVLSNWAQALMESNRYGDASAALDKHLAKFVDHQELLAQRAYCAVKVGKQSEAIELYQRLFAGGFRNEPALETYVGLLLDSGQFPEAVAATDAYLRGGSSSAAEQLQAEVQIRKGNYAEAIKLLSKLLEQPPYQAPIAYRLAEAHLAAQQFHEARQVCDRLLREKYETNATYLLKGRAEYGLKWYTEAKQSLAVAMQLDPADKNAQTYLDLVAGTLGEGNNASVREPIEPVAIATPPAKPAAGDALDPRYKPYGAYYVERIAALEFIPSKSFKRTERRVIRVLDSSGVARFSSFQIPFDPANEQLYVNQLRIVDAAGQTVSMGKINEYYVIDAPTEGGATRAKMLNVPVPGLRPGHTIELMYTSRDLTPPNGMPLHRQNFSSEIPVATAALYVVAPIDRLRDHAERIGPPRSIAGGKVWRIEQPPLYRLEPQAQDVSSYLPRVVVGDAGLKWDQLVKAYMQTIADRFATDPAVKPVVEGATAGLTTESEKIAALVRLVQKSVHLQGNRIRPPGSSPQPTESNHRQQIWRLQRPFTAVVALAKHDRREIESGPAECRWAGGRRHPLARPIQSHGPLRAR